MKPRWNENTGEVFTWYTIEDNQVISYQGTLEETIQYPYPSFEYEEQALEYLCHLHHLGYRTMLRKKEATAA